MAIAIVAIFASCSNDDVTISTSYTINLNAKTVISSFITVEDGALETFDNANEKLRLRTLIYNENGELVTKDVNYFTNYNTQLKTVTNLSAGKYTVIGISDVVIMNGSNVETEFYKLSGESKLSEMTITDQNLIGYAARVLGLGKTSITVADNQPSSVNLDLQPGGALIYYIVWGTHWASVYGYDVESYVLCTNKSTDALSFDESGNYTITENNTSNTFYTQVYIDATEDANNKYYYNFVLPMNNLKVYNRLLYTDGSWDDIMNGTTLNLAAGDEYVCHLDFYDYKEYYKPVTSKDAFNDPAVASSRRASKVLPNVLGEKMSKEIFNQLNHELKVSDIKQIGN